MVPGHGCLLASWLLATEPRTHHALCHVATVGNLPSVINHLTRPYPHLSVSILICTNTVRKPLLKDNARYFWNNLTGRISTAKMFKRTFR